MLLRNAAINAQIYCQQLERFKKALKTEKEALMNRKGVMFHQTLPNIKLQNRITENRTAWLRNISTSTYITLPHIYFVVYNINWRK